MTLSGWGFVNRSWKIIVGKRKIRPARIPFQYRSILRMDHTEKNSAQSEHKDNSPVTRRRFMGCAAGAAGAGVIGSAGAGAGIEASLKRSRETTQAAENGEAL